MRERDRPARWGIDLFVEDGAYTSVAAAVALLVVLALAFSTSIAAWRMARSGDVQVAADATALAGSNVVSSYYTVAGAVDASVASLGMVGLMMAGVGFVGMLIPGAQGAAAKTVDTAIRILDTRNDFAVSASRGLKTLEESLPFLVAANATRTCSAQSAERTSYTGSALAVPRESESEFPALGGEIIPTDGLEEAGQDLEVAGQHLAEARERTAEAKERAWLADCGSPEGNMQERADRLSGLSAVENPDFASSITWRPEAGIERAEAYYEWRYVNDRPEGSGVEEQADAAARHAFYGYACACLERARYEETDKGVAFELELLPRNTADVKRTSLYTDRMWPTTMEAGEVTLHYATSCPGARGSKAGNRSFSDMETGGVRACAVCRFDVGDVGRAPAASSSISNGFEFHFRAYTIAMGDYAAARQAEMEMEKEAMGEATDAGNAFDQAIAAVSERRPRIAPPGREGCVALVVGSTASAPEAVQTPFAPADEVPVRGAISASALAPAPATGEENILASFFSSLEERVGVDGAVGLVDGVMDVWGQLLVSYGDMGEKLAALTDGLLGGLRDLGAGPVATWLDERISGLVRGLDLEPVDMRVRKPVLVDSAQVIGGSGFEGAAGLQNALRSIPAGSSDPAEIMRALRYEVGEYVLGLEFTIAEIPLPLGGSIPLVVKVRDVMGAFEPRRASVKGVGS